MGLFRLFSRQQPKIKIETAKRDGFSGWIQCSGCSEMIHLQELQNHLHCCPKCDHHYRLNASQRIELLCDKNTFEEMFSFIKPTDPLEFVDEEPYKERLASAQQKTGRDEAAIVGVGEIEGVKAAIGVLDFTFMGGSMGSVVGERLTRIIEFATEHHLPLLIVSASGGARMQESIYSLMQMAKTAAALAYHGKKGLPFISLLTNPTMGGVTASFASLGDIIIAEPKALIGFAGPRVVEQTIRQKLPEGAQKSEFLLDKGMVDMIVHRKLLKQKVASVIRFLTENASTNMVPQKILLEKNRESLNKLIVISKAKKTKAKVN